ncbi:phosphatase PAP2 family protein [Luteipulveratus halotolerans]|uniref:phosphatase PAP2 family protein n=1 Tax=Luteipulveratus halotolerans TaxID=1631356 RepID=UPI0012F72E09|nr:phosphatase PAP2 family protein [Luteipulveratus halotolerans]
MTTLGSPPTYDTTQARRFVQRAVHRTFARPGWLPELVLLALGYAAFSLVQARLGSAPGAAYTHADALQRFESALRLDIEVGVNQWLADHLFLTHLAGWFYGAVLVVPPLVLAWMWWRAGEHYRPLRRVLVVTTVASLPVFALYAVAPPRFAMHGIVDVIATHDILNGATSRDSGNGANLYAAMPSLHMAWATWCALAIWWCVRRSHRRLAHLAWIFPAVTAVDVVATGNHYVVDVLAGVGLLLVGLVVTTVWTLSTGSAREQAQGERDHHDTDHDVERTPGAGLRGEVGD